MRPYVKLECGPMPRVMGALPNIGGTFCSTLHSLADPAAGVPCSNVANIGECKTWKQSEFCMWQNSITSKSSRKCIYHAYQPGRRPNIVQSLVGLWWATWLHYQSQDAKPIEICWGAQTPQLISAVCGPKFAILFGHLETILLFNSFFSDCRYMH